MDVEALRAEIARLAPWHHAVEVAPGVTTAQAAAPEGRGEAQKPGAYAPEIMIASLCERVYPNGLEGRSFLDCGCNAGGHVLAARKYGAARAFGFDARRHWIAQAEFLARHLPTDGVAFDTFHLNELPSRGLGTFDITLFSGLLYHLPDPVAGLKIAADQTRELMIVNTSVLPRAEKSLTLSMESDTHVMSGVDRLAWLPSGAEVVRDMLAWCGFPHSRIDFDRRPSKASRWRRIQILAAREERVFGHFDEIAPGARAVTRPALWRHVLRRVFDRLDI